MFVGGLNWDTTDDGLRNYFSQFGKIESCTIMRDPAGRSRGFAFLTFEDPAAVNKVMVQEHYLDGKIIDPKRAIPRTEHQRTVKMFVGGLAPSVTNESMREYFSQFGKVIDSTVMVDRDSSRSKGFGFVTFDDQSGAERLLGMPGLQIDGKNIEVKMAQPRAGMAAERNMNNNAGFNRGGGGGGGGGGGSGGGSGYGNNYNNNMAGGGGNAGMGGGGGGNMGMGMGGNTPFDPQALATLYQRMAQLAGGGGVGQGGMGWGMNGMAVNPMMGMGGGMGMMNAGMGGGMGGGGMMGGPGGGGSGMMGGGGGMNAHGGGNMRGGNIPRGPAAMRGGGAGSNAGGNMGSPGGGTGIPTGPSGGLGPARMGRGHQHNYHPYSR
ncbi:RNA-binding domain-containing protein [Serendipita vermifera]|nr:RNA-binding domain-containing protein [Serendipita vermifera]